MHVCLCPFFLNGPQNHQLVTVIGANLIEKENFLSTDKRSKAFEGAKGNKYKSVLRSLKKIFLLLSCCIPGAISDFSDSPRTFNPFTDDGETRFR
jgi:hypothetical protein